MPACSHVGNGSGRPHAVYDAIISGSTILEVATRVRVPTLVHDSQDSTGDLTGWAAAVVGALPNGVHRHGVPDEALAPILTRFFLD